MNVLGSLTVKDRAGDLDPSGLLMSKTAVPAGDTVANTTTETNFATNFQIPAGSLKVGQVLKLTALGTRGATSSGTNGVTFRIKFGSTVLCVTFGSVTFTNSQSGRGWMLNALLTVISVGASGSVETGGTVIDFAATAAGLPNQSMASNLATVNTTVAQTLQISAQWSAANASNTITMRQLIVELLNP